MDLLQYEHRNAFIELSVNGLNANPFSNSRGNGSLQNVESDFYLIQYDRLYIKGLKGSNISRISSLFTYSGYSGWQKGFSNKRIEPKRLSG